MIHPQDVYDRNIFITWTSEMAKLLYTLSLKKGPFSGGAPPEWGIIGSTPCLGQKVALEGNEFLL